MSQSSPEQLAHAKPQARSASKQSSLSARIYPRLELGLGRTDAGLFVEMAVTRSEAAPASASKLSVRGPAKVAKAAAASEAGGSGRDLHLSLFTVSAFAVYTYFQARPYRPYRRGRTPAHK